MQVVIPPYDYIENIVNYFNRYKLSSYVILTPFLRLPHGVSETEYINSIEVINNYYSDSQKPENNVTWRQIINELGLKSISYMNEVLLISSGFLHQSSRFDFNSLRQDAKKLEKWLSEHQILMPSEGNFPAQYELHYLKAMLDCGYKTAIFSDDIPSQTVEAPLKTTIEKIESKNEFLSEVITEVLGIRSISSSDLKITFTVHQESFFTVLAAEKELIPHVLKGYPYEGFYPDEGLNFLL